VYLEEENYVFKILFYVFVLILSVFTHLLQMLIISENANGEKVLEFPPKLVGAHGANLRNTISL
jgi:hypothetical protein